MIETSLINYPQLQHQGISYNRIISLLAVFNYSWAVKSGYCRPRILCTNISIYTNITYIYIFHLFVRIQSLFKALRMCVRASCTS